MDELRNAIKGKMDQSLERIVRKTDSPFTMAVQDCPVPSKFCLPQLEPFNRLKDPLDHLNTFRTTLGLQQPLDEILCHSFPTTLKGAAREWFNKLPTSSIDNRSEEHTSELQSRRHISYAVFCLKRGGGKAKTLAYYFHSSLLSIFLTLASETFWQAPRWQTTSVLPFTRS